MKYIDAEKVKSLLRERYNAYKIGQHSPFRSGKVETLRETIELINSLQQEQVVMSDTDKSNLRDVPAIIRASNHPFKENLALTLEKYIK